MEHFGDSGRLPSEQVFWRFGPIGPPYFGDFEKSDRNLARRAARAAVNVVRAPGARFGSELRSICVSEAEARTHTECDFPLHIAQGFLVPSFLPFLPFIHVHMANVLSWAGERSEPGFF